MKRWAVNWCEGMALTPQHLQAADRHLMRRAGESADWVHPFGYGLRRLELTVRHEEVVLSECEARFKDGSTLTIPEDIEPRPAESRPDAGVQGGRLGGDGLFDDSRLGGRANYRRVADLRRRQWRRSAGRRAVSSAQGGAEGRRFRAAAAGGLSRFAAGARDAEFGAGLAPDDRPGLRAASARDRCLGPC